MENKYNPSGMLVLTRREGEKVIIYPVDNPDKILTIVVTAIEGRQVKLAFNGPGYVIDREEIYREKQRARQSREQPSKLETERL